MEVQTLHKTLEHEMQIEEEKLKETKKNYNPTSERIFHIRSVRFTRRQQYHQNSVQRLNIQSESKDEDNSSIKTVI